MGMLTLLDSDLDLERVQVVDLLMDLVAQMVLVHWMALQKQMVFVYHHRH